MKLFLFGLLCAASILFGAGLALFGLARGDYLMLAAGGVFLFGGLLTFGMGQMSHGMEVMERRFMKLGLHRDEPQPSIKPQPNIRPQPDIRAFAANDSDNVARWPDPPRPNPVLERVASRFARPGR